MTSIFAGRRPAPPTSNIAGTDLENMLESAILRQDQQAYEEVYSAIFAIALSRRQRDLIAKLAPQDKELREIGIPSALARLLFSAFRTKPAQMSFRADVLSFLRHRATHERDQAEQ